MPQWRLEKTVFGHLQTTGSLTAPMRLWKFRNRTDICLMEQSEDFPDPEDGQIVSLDNNEGAIKNQIKRGDLNFVKVADSTLERLANVPFRSPA